MHCRLFFYLNRFPGTAGLWEGNVSWNSPGSPMGSMSGPPNSPPPITLYFVMGAPPVLRKALHFSSFSRRLVLYCSNIDLPPGTSPLSKLDLGPFEVHNVSKTSTFSSSSRSFPLKLSHIHSPRGCRARCIRSSPQQPSASPEPPEP